MHSLGESSATAIQFSRRSFLTAGAIGGGLSLAGLLRAEAAVGAGSSRKAVINIHLDGGPPQMDMIDLKPQAPAEIRGEFNPIATKVPGIQICEHLPKLAAIADKVASFARSSARPAPTTPFNVKAALTPRTCPASAAGRRWAPSSASCVARRRMSPRRSSI